MMYALACGGGEEGGEGGGGGRTYSAVEHCE